MRRRQFLTGLGSAAILPGLAKAQQQGQRRTVGILDPAVAISPNADELMRVFKEKMREYGWIEDETIRFDRRKVGTDVELARREAAALIELKPDVLVAGSTVVAAAVAERTRDIPIVFIGVADPIQAGFSEGLARPSRNLTGFTVFDPDMGGKVVQFLKEVKPDLNRVTAILNPDIGAGKQFLSSFLAKTRQFASDMGLELREAHVHNSAEIEGVISALGQGDALWAGADTTIFANVKLIIELTARQKIPAIYSWPQHVRAGGLMAYSLEQAELMRNFDLFSTRE